MKPAKTTVVTALSLVLMAGPVSQAQTPPPDSLERIREAINRPTTLKVENGKLRIYVEVIAAWPNFAEVTKGYDFMNGPTGFGNPMSHQEFLNMVTPQDMYSSAGIKPAEVVTMAVVGLVGQWALGKGLAKLAAYNKNKKVKQLRDIQERIDLELLAIKK